LASALTWVWTTNQGSALVTLITALPDAKQCSDQAIRGQARDFGQRAAKVPRTIDTDEWRQLPTRQRQTHCSLQQIGRSNAESRCHEHQIRNTVFLGFFGGINRFSRPASRFAGIDAEAIEGFGRIMRGESRSAGPASNRRGPDRG
jgi:hypothetical protein